MTKKVLFLFSDTGGGHRSAFQAIQDAMKIRYGDAVDFDAVDVLRECKWPLNKQPELYPRVVNTSKFLWALVYHSFDGRRRTGLARQLIYRNNRRILRRIVAEHPAMSWSAPIPLSAIHRFAPFSRWTSARLS